MRAKIDIPPGYTAVSIASDCGVHPVTIYRAFAGGLCSGTLAILIHYATKGATPAWTLRPDYWKEGQVPPELTANASDQSSSSDPAA